MALLICWLPAKFRYHAIGQWNRSVIFALRWLGGIHHHTIGLPNLPKPPYVICANHQSAWETIICYQIFPRNAFVVKRSLLLIPFFGWGLALCMAPIPINRGTKLSAFKSVIKTGQQRLQDGVCVVLFPEGTRVAPGTQLPFQPSAFALAVNTGVPVVPVAHNSGSCWPRGRQGFIKHPGVITLSIGKPISTKGKKIRQVCAEAERWIQGEVQRLGSGVSH